MWCWDVSKAQEATGSGGMEPSLNEHNSVGGENLMLQVALPWAQRVWIELPAPRLHGLALQSPHQQNKVMCVCSVTQLCSTLCDPVDCSAPGSSVHGIFQARTLEWVAISSSRRSSCPRKPGLLPHRRLLHLLSHGGSPCIPSIPSPKFCKGTFSERTFCLPLGEAAYLHLSKVAFLEDYRIHLL